MGFIWLPLCVMCLALSFTLGQEGPTVTISSGPIKGVYVIADYNITEFLGIPYAKPPVQELRFAPPLPPDPWSNVRDAGQLGASCYQSTETLRRSYPDEAVDNLVRSFDEDCLYINVYIPQTTPLDLRDPLAVMVWISGTHRATAAPALEDPHTLSSLGNVVVVTFNFRVGPLGSYGPNGASNTGLMDQQLALKWVKDNIGSFAGDPRRVTIFGENEGANSVSLHVLSPGSVDLFSYAISMGSVSAEDWVPRATDVKDLTDAFVQTLACEDENPTNVMTCLREKPAAVVNAVNVYLPVVVDGEFLVDDPFSLWNQSRFNNVDYILGCNCPPVDLQFTVDPRIFDTAQPGILISDIRPDIERITKSEGYPIKGEILGDRIQRAIEDQYLLDFSDRFTNLIGFSAMKRDTRCAAPLAQVAGFIERAGQKAYIYEYCGSVEDVTKTGTFFHTPGSLLIGGRQDLLNPGDETTKKIIISYASTLARSGNPQWYNSDANEIFKWPSFDKDSEYLHFGDNFAISNPRKRPYPDAISFWTVLLPALAGQDVIITSPDKIPENDDSPIFDRETMQWVLIALSVACVLLLLGMIGAFFLFYDARRQGRKRGSDDNKYNNTIDY